ncbi:MAG TPA: hypothetical protein VG345_16660 [Bryobacteraceae bacterium]|nr:hypothetical protein [Bryobacteraceae bacterium]
MSYLLNPIFLAGAPRSGLAALLSSRRRGFGLGDMASDIVTLQSIGANQATLSAYQSGQIDFPTAMNLATGNYSSPIIPQNPGGIVGDVLFNTGDAVSSVANATILPGASFAAGADFTSGIDLTKSAPGLPPPAPDTPLQWLGNNWVYLALGLGALVIVPKLL